MALQFGPTKIGAMQYNGVTIGEAMMNGQIVYKSGPPVVHITGEGGFNYTSRDQFRQACIDYGTTYDTVVELPFLLDTSQAVGMVDLFAGCSALTTVPAMDTSNVEIMYRMFASCSSLTYVPDLQAGNATNVRYMFVNCVSLTDGNVRLIGKHPSVNTSDMIRNSGLTRLPFYNTNGNPI